MSRSWSGIRKILEQELLCESLKGRVQYFYTHYHMASDNYGRFCVRVDGEEMVFANPFNQNKIYAYANKMQKERGIPSRVWDGKGYLYDEENSEIEEEAAKILMNEGNMDMWQIFDAIDIYLKSNIQDAVNSENEAVRMFAVLDRRIGKRTLMKLKGQVDKQPEWLRFFYRLRLEAEGIND